MIKNKNLQMGLLVFFITLIVLITLVVYPEEDSNALENQPETIDKDTQEKLETAVM